VSASSEAATPGSRPSSFPEDLDGYRKSADRPGRRPRARRVAANLAARLGVAATREALAARGSRRASAGDLLATVQIDWYWRTPAIRLAEAHEGRRCASTPRQRSSKRLVMRNGRWGNRCSRLRARRRT
jgi:hypothetical protein